MTELRIETTRLSPGVYRICREDGHSITVQKGVTGWLSGGRTKPSLKCFRWEMANRHTPKDYLDDAYPPKDPSPPTETRNDDR